MRRLRALLVSGLALVLAGCASPGLWPPGASQTRAPVVVKDRSVSAGAVLTPNANAKVSGASSPTAPVVAPSGSEQAPQQLAVIAPKPAVQSLLQQARQLQQQGQTQQALSRAERALRLDPREPQVYVLLMELYDASGLTTQAEEMARRGLSVARNDQERRLFSARLP